MKIVFTLTIVFISLLISNGVNAQSAVTIPHSFSVSSPPTAFPTVGNTNVIFNSADNDAVLISPTGFTFTFGGIVYEKVVISTNGWIALVPASVTSVPPTLSSALPVNDLSNNTTGYPILAPLWDDLSTAAVTWNWSAGSLRIRWNTKWQNTNPLSQPLFWIQLDTASDSIYFHYANNTTYIPTTPSASIGIAGVCTGDFYSVYPTSSNTAYIDSITENVNIGQGGPTTARPYNCTYTFTPQSRYDNCNNARDFGTITTNCVPTLMSTVNATSSGTGNCSTTDVNDVWIKFYKPAGMPIVNIVTTPASCQSVSGTSIEVYDSCGGNILGCSTSGTANPSFAELTLNRCLAETLYVRITSDNDSAGGFNICVKSITGLASIQWAGTVDSVFSLTANWLSSACDTAPSCQADVVISANAVRSPVITNNVSVHDITIDAGATLTINPGCVLEVCGNFNNYGTLNAAVGSTVRFIGTGNQNITGLLINNNAFGNLEIQNSGSVSLQTDIDVQKNFLVSSVTSVFNINGHYMKVGGDFTNYDGSTTIGVGGSTIEFNGNVHQYYTNTNGNDTLCKVKMNKPAGKLYLIATYGNMNIDTLLDLTSGNIVTDTMYEVNIIPGVPGAVINHNPNSFVDGRLRRRLFLGDIDFPVGDSLVPNQGGQNGYELATVSFTSSTAIQTLLVWFNIWPGTPPVGPSTVDNCNTYSTVYDSLTFLDHGYWSIERNSAVFNGTYNLSLHNTGGTNGIGTNWSIGTSDILSNPLSSPSWNLIGICDAASTQALDLRNQFNNPSSNATSFNHNYGAVQSLSTISGIGNLEQTDFTIYPNPANFSFEISWPEQQFSFVILDVLGQELFRQENVFSRYEVRELFAAGTYFVKTVNKSGDVREEKIVIID